MDNHPISRDKIINISRILEECPSFHQIAEVYTPIDNFEMFFNISTIRRQIITAIITMKDEKTLFRNIIIHLQVYLITVLEDSITYIDPLILRFQTYFNVDIKIMTDYIFYLFNSIYVLSNMTTTTRYKYMDQLIFISDSFLDLKGYMNDELLKNEIINICQLRNYKNMYIKLCIIGLESIIKWHCRLKEGLYSISNNKNYRYDIENIENEEIIDFIDHDWIKICSHGIYISNTYILSDSDDDYILNVNADPILDIKRPPGL